MKAKKHIVIKLELKGNEVSVFQEILMKVLAVDSSVSPTVMSLLHDEQVHLLEKLQRFFP